MVDLVVVPSFFLIVFPYWSSVSEMQQRFSFLVSKCAVQHINRKKTALSILDFTYVISLYCSSVWHPSIFWSSQNWSSSKVLEWIVSGNEYNEALCRLISLPLCAIYRLELTWITYDSSLLNFLFPDA